MNLDTQVDNAGRFFARFSKPLEKLQIKTLEDLLYHVPFRYDDFSLISKIGQMQEGEIVTIQGIVKEIKNQYAKSGLKLQKAIVSDDTGSVAVTWYNQPFLPKIIHENDFVSLSAKVGKFGSKQVLESPEYEVLSDLHKVPIHTGRLVPVYPETKGITSKWLRRQIYSLLNDHKDTLKDFVPEDIIIKYNFPPLSKALQTVHFPNNLSDAQKARERLAFDEVFKIQLQSLQRRHLWEQTIRGHTFEIQTFQEHIKAFFEKLPFELTGAQRRTLNEIFSDLSKTKPMNRLLEGDVGSGKTVVASVAMYIAHLNGFQSVLMAPTEILAEQHYKTIYTLLRPFGVSLALATGSKKIDINAFDILTGTHAVLSEKINYDKLGLVVIDEQQRFGVEQRTLIRKKGDNPHLLTMTATPIPRTVALTLYGDLDLSVLDEMPKGRKIIKTWLVSEEKRLSAYNWIEAEIQKNHSQVFILCPFIEESESMQTVKAAKLEFERLQEEVFPKLRLGLLHGKLSSKEKQMVLNDFQNGKLDILICTPVVEVGIDIPNATIMLIEASDRFGLAQLHQLRGRVGRGEKQSYCLLFSDNRNYQTQQRLKSLETIHIGSELAELDLKLRGPGDLYGTKQHGALELKIARFSDFPLIEKARKEAEAILPNLSSHKTLEEKLQTFSAKDVSPD